MKNISARNSIDLTVEIAGIKMKNPAYRWGKQGSRKSVT